MTKITQKQLIESLRQLKEIKPRQEWASLLKSQILETPSFAEATEGQANPVTFASVISNFKFQISNSRRLAYALSVFMVLVVGIFGITKLLPSTEAPKQTASLTSPMVLSQEVAVLHSKINDLATASKTQAPESISPAVTEIKAKASELAKNLKNNPNQDPQTIKDIASSLKTLADVPGTDLTATADVKDLYQTVVQNQIDDLQKATLTDNQKKILTEIEDLNKQGDYSKALEKILLINK